MTRKIHRPRPKVWGKPFQKGKPGGPGRPKGSKSIPDMLRAIGNRPVDEWLLTKLHAKYGPNHNPKTMLEATLMAAAFDAANGDQHARDFIAERTEGKVAQATVNLNANQDVEDLTKMPLAEMLALAQDLKQS